MSKIAPPFVPFTDHQACPPEDAPVFARLADRIQAGEDATTAIDHMTRRQINHAARALSPNRPLVASIDDARRTGALPALVAQLRAVFA